MTEPAAEATCRTCGKTFIFNPEFYVARHISPPKACGPCRLSFRSRCVEVTGEVEKIVPDQYAFAALPDGRRVFIGLRGVHREVLPLSCGDVLVLGIDPNAEVKPGQKPRAASVRRP